VSTKEKRALWHPTRAQITEVLRAGPATQSSLTESIGAPYPEVAYHCRALRRSRCIHYAPLSGPESDDPIYESA
jgi:hypothetical protein